MTEHPSTRIYGGVSAERRRAERLRRLLDAGLEVIGTKGYAGTTVKGVCRRARLTERYFYEAFADREALLRAVYDDVVARVIGSVAAALIEAPADPAARARAGLRAFFATLTGDRRLARVQLIEVVGVSAELERHRRSTMHTFARIISRNAQELIPEAADNTAEVRLTSLALVGATNELVTDWLLGYLKESPEELADHCAALFLATIGALDAQADATD